jgi:hypothetical protein
LVQSAACPEAGPGGGSGNAVGLQEKAVGGANTRKPVLVSDIFGFWGKHQLHIVTFFPVPRA